MYLSVKTVSFLFFVPLRSLRPCEKTWCQTSNTGRLSGDTKIDGNCLIKSEGLHLTLAGYFRTVYSHQKKWLFCRKYRYRQWNHFQYIWHCLSMPAWDRCDNRAKHSTSTGYHRGPVLAMQENHWPGKPDRRSGTTFHCTYGCTCRQAYDGLVSIHSCMMT